jgi:hypothetical protein
MSRRSATGFLRLLSCAAGLFMLYVLWLMWQHAPWTATAVASLLVSPVVAWKWLRRPPPMDKLIRHAMTGFSTLPSEGWQKAEKAAAHFYPKSRQRNLLYALRISSIVPTITKVPTLASRWSTAQRGPGEYMDGGLLTAGNDPLANEVTAFLTRIYQDRLRVILADDAAKVHARINKSRNEETRDRYRMEACQKLWEWESEFDFELPGNKELFRHYRAALGDSSDW